jgi:PilZ domain-containing protein
MSTPAQQAPLLTTTLERRFYPRVVPQTPIFFACRENESEESLLLNVSENGLLVSTPTGLPCNFVARLSVPLNGLPKPVQVIGRVAWTSEARKMAGIQLLDLSEHDRQQIRKWGARESTQSWQPKPDRPPLVAPPSTSSSEAPHATSQFPEDAPFSTPHDTVALAPPLVVNTRPASTAARRAMRATLVATICLAAAVILIKAGPGNPFARSKDIRPEPAAAPTAQETQPAPRTPDMSNGASATQVASLAPTDNAAVSRRAHTTGASPHQHSEKTVEVSSEAASDENPAKPQSDLSWTGALPAATEAASVSTSAFPPSPDLNEVQKQVTPEPEIPRSPDPPTPKQPLRNPTHTTEPTADTSPIVPSTLPPSAPVAPSRSPFSPKSDAPVIRMDPPRNQTFEIHLTGGHQASFLSLPGERVLESPSITVRIQRSVRLPATHAGWPFNRNKKVVVGELISRVEPQATQIPTSPANSVRVKATVAKDGHIEDVNQVLGPASLFPAVAKALHEWRYQPTLVDDKPVETQCYVVFQFHTPSYRAAKR